MPLKKKFPLLKLGLPFILLLPAFVRLPVPRALPDSIRIESGLVAGTLHTKTGVTVFKGIPFAAPPVGGLRWKAPEPAAAWNGVRRCDQFSASPMQPTPKPFFVIGPEFTVPEKPLSEDCLYLNIWTAAVSAGEKRPVFVWIYGGGFFSGGAAAAGYDGEAMAKKGVVFVSFNYRLGVFGFLAHPALTAESAVHSSGNYGLLDQIAALKWVRRNIQAFGGDPDNVTIAGQSAGSVSVNCLLVSPLTKGLFQRAIAESGTLVLPNPILNTLPLAKAEKQGLQLNNSLQATTLGELRAIPAERIEQKTSGFFAPVVDGYVLKSPVPEAYAAGDQNHIPFLTGWNGDEGFLFMIKKKNDYLKEAARFGADSSLFLQYYPAGSDEEAARSQIALSRDQMIGVASYFWALEQNKNGATAKTYVYNFLRKPPPPDAKTPGFGAYHTAEIGYALDNLDKIERPWTATDNTLAETISSYWINFARTGDPNGAGLPVWPAFTAIADSVMVFDENAQAAPLPGKGGLDFLLKRYPK
jgi:para-nitrobenzyl esterase